MIRCETLLVENLVFYSPILYRIDDTKKIPGCFEITGSEFLEKAPALGLENDFEMLRSLEAHKFNQENFGIFWPVNEFAGPRKKENLKKLRAWFVECDGGNKQKLITKFKNSPLSPSLLVESKNGYHAYWFCDQDATVEEYRSIIEHRLIPFFGGDPNAKDISRILRVPGYMHCKDPQNKFLIKTIHQVNELVYSEEEMLRHFPLTKTAEREILKKNQTQSSMNVGDVFEKIYDLDCKEALERLSGEACVQNEKFLFRRNANGNLNILVDGRGTSCWIDASGRIGSNDGGGPTVWQWLRWYGNSDKEIYQIMRKYFPEVFDD